MPPSASKARAPPAQMLVVLGMVPKQWHALAQRGKPAQTPRPHPQIGGVGAAQTRLPSWLPAARSGAQPFLLAQVTLSGNANEHAQSCLFASTCGHGHCACMHARTLTRADAHPRLLPKSTPPRQTSGGALSPATRRCAGGVRRGGEPGARVETQRPSLQWLCQPRSRKRVGCVNFTDGKKCSW